MCSSVLKEQIQLNKMRKLKFRAWNNTQKYMASGGIKRTNLLISWNKKRHVSQRTSPKPKTFEL